MKNSLVFFSSEILLYSQDPTNGVHHTCMANDSIPHPTMILIFAFFFYILLGCQAAFSVRLFPSKPCSLLACNVPSPINDKETDLLYYLRNLAFPF
jgi:hypothetical protein